MTLGELYIVVTNSNGDTIVAIKEDLETSIVRKKLSQGLDKLMTDPFAITNILMEGQRVVDMENGKTKVKNSKGKYVIAKPNK